MTPKLALEKRNQMLLDGFCIIEDIISAEFLYELERETEFLISQHQEPPDVVYQGQHIDVHRESNKVINKLLSWKQSKLALTELGFGDFVSTGKIIVLTKEPKGPPLYWHQDWMQWNDPLSTSPWPQIIFLNYYLSDTSIKNGCMKVIPGTHLKRIKLHDLLIPAHEQGARFIPANQPIMFSDHPEQIDVTVKAGSLVLGDARILHSARRNQTDKRRTLVLAWHTRPENSIPDYWNDIIPNVIAKRNPNETFQGSRIPGRYLK